MALPQVNLTDPKALRGYAHPLRMALLGLLRVQGPMTATQAAGRLNESVPSCSFHLRQLAKYGLAERVAGADGRERPWQATAHLTYWDDVSDDPEMRAAADQLSAVALNHYVKRAQAFLAQRGSEPSEWRGVTGFGDTLLYVTASEMAELTRKLDALLAEFDERITDPSARPEGARGIGIIRMALPLAEEPPQPTRETTSTARTSKVRPLKGKLTP
jgi:hypothetical protein